jgi:hypothetical protein
MGERAWKVREKCIGMHVRRQEFSTDVQLVGQTWVDRGEWKRRRGFGTKRRKGREIGLNHRLAVPEWAVESLRAQGALNVVEKPKKADVHIQ